MTPTDEHPTLKLMAERGLTDADIHLPTGNVAVFGRSGTGKSSLFFGSRFLGCILLADTGSTAHRLYTACEVVTIDPAGDDSPISVVLAKVEECARAKRLWLLDSWTTLQEQQVAWLKLRNRKKAGRGANAPQVSLRDHQGVVGELRDLALVLSRSPGFTVFNTSPGGKGRTPEGAEVVYPAGAITGYPSLSGVGLNSETILARWSNVWGVFQGYRDIPRGLYVPANDIRPDAHALYSPLKDPLMVIRDTTAEAGREGKGIMAVPNLADPANRGRCFVDELLVEIATRWPLRPRQPIPVQPAPEPPPAQAQAAPPPPEAPAAAPPPADGAPHVNDEAEVRRLAPVIYHGSRKAGRTIAAGLRRHGSRIKETWTDPPDEAAAVEAFADMLRKGVVTVYQVQALAREFAPKGQQGPKQPAA